MKLRPRVHRHRRLIIVVAILSLGLCLRLNVLGASLTLDDWDHYAMQQGIYPVKLHPLDMFNFVPNDPGARRALLESGRLPWFAAPNLHLSVLRPLSSALVYADYAWLDVQHHLSRIHVHSLVWWLALIALAGAILFHTLPPAAATLALFIYTIDDVHTWPLIWAANRSQIIANALVFAALYTNIRASEGVRRMRWIALLLCGLGLLAGEHALPPIAYLIAFELFGTAGTFASRSLRASPWVALGAVFVIVHSMLGYGVAGSSVYLSPTADPEHYVAVSGQRLARLLAELGFSIPAEWWHQWPAHELVQSSLDVLKSSGFDIDRSRLQLALGVLTAVFATGFAARLAQRRSQSSPALQSVAWLLTGALASLLPLTATEAMSRLNVAPALGFSALYGWAAIRLFHSVAVDKSPLRRVAAAAAIAFAGYLWVFFPARRSYAEGHFIGSVIGEAPLAAARRLTDFGVADLAGRNVLIVDSADVTVQGSLMFMLHLQERPLPHSIEILTPAIATPHVLERVASNVLDIRFPDGVLGRPFSQSIYHNDDQPFFAGQVVLCARFNVVILAVTGGEPSHLRLVFPVPLEDARYIWMAPRRNPPGIAQFEPPAIGASLRLPAAFGAP